MSNESVLGSTREGQRNELHSETLRFKEDPLGVLGFSGLGFREEEGQRELQE